MRFPSLVALVSLASCAFAQDTSIADVVTAFNNANVPNAFGIRFNPTALLQVTFTRNGVPTTFSSGTNVPRDATAPVPTFKLVGASDPGPYVIATVDPDGGQFGHPSPGAGNPAHRYVFWAFKQSPNFNEQRLVTAQTYIGNWNLSSFAAQTGLGDPVAASFMLVRQ
ncbi:hypothetical protein H1R20_g671, partial [Candolleomyces eurysporus]